MKPSRRLGKGLADMVGLHAGTIVTSAPADEIDDGEAAPASVLHLLSTEAEGLPGPRVVMPGAPPVQPAAAPALPAAVTEPEPEPVAAPAPVVTPAPVAPPIETVAAPEPVVEVAAPDPEPEPEPVSGAFEDEWFDPPIAAFSPAGDFHRVDQSQDAPLETPPAALPDLSALPPAPSRIAAIPEPQPEPEPVEEPQPVLDDPVIVDDGLFFDDVVVGDFLPEVDLDS